MKHKNSHIQKLSVARNHFESSTKVNQAESQEIIKEASRADQRVSWVCHFLSQ